MIYHCSCSDIILIIFEEVLASPTEKSQNQASGLQTRQNKALTPSSGTSSTLSCILPLTQSFYSEQTASWYGTYSFYNLLPLTLLKLLRGRKLGSGLRRSKHSLCLVRSLLHPAFYLLLSLSMQVHRWALRTASILGVCNLSYLVTVKPLSSWIIDQEEQIPVKGAKAMPERLADSDIPALEQKTGSKSEAVCTHDLPSGQTETVTASFRTRGIGMLQKTHKLTQR